MTSTLILNTSAGSVSVTQTRTSGIISGDRFEYTVNTSISSPQNFKSMTVLSLDPTKIFLYEKNSDGTESYLRLCTAEDFFRYPIDLPSTDLTEPYYRKNNNTKVLTSPQDAISYSRSLYEAINNFFLILRDYEMTVTNTTEVGEVPNLDNSFLYQTIQEYLQTESNQEVIELDLAKLESKKDAQQAAYNSLLPLINISEQNNLKLNIQTFSSSIMLVKSSVDSLYNTFKSGTSSFNAAYTDLDTTMNDFMGLYSSFNSGWDTLKGLIVDEEASTRNQVVDTNLYSGKMATIKNSTYTQKKQAFDISVSNTAAAINTSKSTFDSNFQTMLDTSTLLLGYINISVSIFAQLQREIDNTGLEIESKKNELNNVLVLKQILASKLLDLAPEIDLTDPMAIYNHRIFKWVDEA